MRAGIQRRVGFIAAYRTRNRGSGCTSVLGASFRVELRVPSTKLVNGTITTGEHRVLAIDLSLPDSDVLAPLRDPVSNDE